MLRTVLYGENISIVTFFYLFRLISKTFNQNKLKNGNVRLQQSGITTKSEFQ